MKYGRMAGILLFLLMFVGTSSPALSQNETYIPIDGEKDIFAEWAEFSPEDVSETDPFLEVARNLAPLICQALVHNSNFDLTKDDVVSLGLEPGVDQKIYFSGQAQQRLTPDIGWIQVSVGESRLEVFPFPEYRESEEYSEIAEILMRDYPEIVNETASRVGVFIIAVLTFNGEEHLIQFPLVESKEGRIHLFPRWFMASDVVDSIRVSRDAISSNPEMDERLERRVEEQQRRIDARVRPVEERRASGSSFAPFLIWGGIGCIVLGVAFVIFRKSRMA